MDGLKGFISRKRDIIAFIMLLLISLIALAAQSWSVDGISKKYGYMMISSIQKGFSQAGLGFRDAFHSIGELREIRREYEQLQDQLAEYRSLERKLVDLRNENAQLKSLLSFSGELDHESIPARIIAKEPGSLFTGFTIDKGSADGIEMNSAVISFSEGFTCLVGKIVAVSRRTSKILPLTDHSCYVAARMQESRYEGLINGNGNISDTVIMEYVKKQAKTEIDFADLVITSGLRSIYPPDLYIGRVAEIKAPEWETSLTLEVTPLIDFSRLEYVFILEKGEK